MKGIKEVYLTSSNVINCGTSRLSLQYTNIRTNYVHKIENKAFGKYMYPPVDFISPLLFLSSNNHLGCTFLVTVFPVRGAQ
jgi:hypothetical protein